MVTETKITEDSNIMGARRSAEGPSALLVFSREKGERESLP